MMGVEGGGWRWKCEGEVSGGGDRELAGNQFLRGGASLPAMLVTHLGTFELPN